MQHAPHITQIETRRRFEPRLLATETPPLRSLEVKPLFCQNSPLGYNSLTLFFLPSILEMMSLCVALTSPEFPV